MTRVPRSLPFALLLIATSVAAQDRMLTYSTTFGRGSGEIREVAVDADGNIIIASSSARFSVARPKASASLATSVAAATR